MAKFSYILVNIRNSTSNQNTNVHVAINMIMYMHMSLAQSTYAKLTPGTGSW